MFDLDASKIVIVGVAALIFIPPKDLPRVMRQVGHFVGKMRRMANEFQGQFMDAMREADMADLRQEAQKLSDAVRIDAGLNSVHDIDRHMMPLASTTAPSVAPATPVADAGSLARSARAEPEGAPRQADIPADRAPAGGAASLPPSSPTASYETHPTA